MDHFVATQKALNEVRSRGRPARRRGSAIDLGDRPTLARAAGDNTVQKRHRNERAHRERRRRRRSGQRDDDGDDDDENHGRSNDRAGDGERERDADNAWPAGAVTPFQLNVVVDSPPPS